MAIFEKNCIDCYRSCPLVFYLEFVDLCSSNHPVKGLGLWLWQWAVSTSKTQLHDFFLIMSLSVCCCCTERPVAFRFPTAYWNLSTYLKCTGILKVYWSVLELKICTGIVLEFCYDYPHALV